MIFTVDAALPQKRAWLREVQGLNFRPMDGVIDVAAFLLLISTMIVW